MPELSAADRSARSKWSPQMEPAVKEHQAGFSSGIKRERIPPPQTTWIPGPSLEYASDVGRLRGLRIGDRRPLRERPDGVHQPVNRILIADCEHSANLLFSGRNGCTLFSWMKELTF